jgi:regulator of sigma E protease
MAVLDIVVFVVVLGGLILGHEFGHFVAARSLGVEVEEFGLGFPPRLATLFTWRGTRFTLNLIPLGGFVRPAGEDDPEVPGGLASAGKLVRATVLFAGPTANVILAFFAFAAAFKFAAPDPNRVLVIDVVSGSPAETAGLKTGDIITSVAGQPVTGFESLQTAIAARLGQPVSLGVTRDGQSLTLDLTPRTSPPEGQGPIGITLGYPTRQVSWVEAMGIGWQSTAMQFNELVHLPGNLLSGQVAPQDARVSGLKGMYDMFTWAGEVDRSSQRPFLTLNLIGVISAGLAVANLLPFPALDGGRLMFVAIETVIGRRVSPKYEGLAHAIGFAILLALMVYVNFQDFVNPIVLPR